MARGTTDQSGVKTLFYANPYMKKDNEPWIKIIGKVGEKWIEVAKEKWISGFITDIRPVEIKYKDEEPKPGISLTLTDFKADEAYIFRIATDSSFGRDLILRLAKAEDLNVTLKVKVYQNEAGYNNLSLRLGGDLDAPPRLYDRAWEKSLTKEIEDGGKKFYLRGDLNTAMAEIFADLVKRYSENKMDNAPEKDPFESHHAESIDPKGRGNDIFEAPPTVAPTMDDVPVQENDDLPF